MTAGDRKKLIEVALPLDAINTEAAREKSIRHGHPSTLHLWWARRPLAACRAVLFAQLVDDPSAHPALFPTEEAQEVERARLFRIIEDLVKWENVTNETVLEAARAEIRRSCGGDPPPIVDPFAGGGSIPLEAQRLGLEAHASDLNPVAVLINKALIEIPPRWSGRPPVHPDDGATLGNQSWAGAQGLAADVRHFGQWMRDRAEERIGHLYPTATLDDGTEATVIAWIWARTVTCPNPACGATMPLASSFWLGKKKGKEAWVKPIVDGKQIRFEIGHDPSGPPDPPKVGRGAKFRCLVCGEVAADEYTHSQIDTGNSSSQLMAVVAEGHRQRVYLPPSEAHEQAATASRPSDSPDAPARGTFGGNAQGRRYGFKVFADYFTNRQLTALCTFSDLVGEARTRIVADAKAAGMTDDDAEQYADDVATYLGLGVSRTADMANSLCSWSSSRDQAVHLFGRQAIPMVWDFAEVSPLAGAAGDLNVSLGSIIRALTALPTGGDASVLQASAADRSFDGLVVSTDPPYYDNIGYADLSDFFYVWLRRSLRSVHPDLLGTMLTPKAEELIATPYRFDGSKERAKQFFEDGFVETFTHAAEQQLPGFPMTIFYAFKQSESDIADGVASTGWETMLEGLMQAGLTITGTWPMRTERVIGLKEQVGALASSIVLVCRPRSETSGVTDRAGFLAALRSELPEQLHVLQQAAIAPVDLAQASIGPGMAVFSRYAKVVEPSGDPMRVRTALGLINQVLDEVLNEQDAELDPDTRWAVKWFETRGMDAGPYGEAELLSTATGVSINGLVDSGIVASVGNKTRLLERSELPEDWDPATDDRISVWEATQHLVRVLEDHGEAAAAELLARLGGVGDSAQLLAYRLYSICERKGWATEAGPYNALAAVWGSLQSMAAATGDDDTDSTNEQGSLL